eukprot:scaffold102665_cov30-Tisochrysis_lutea.AAC.2
MARAPSPPRVDTSCPQQSSRNPDSHTLPAKVLSTGHVASVLMLPMLSWRACGSGAPARASPHGAPHPTRTSPHYMAAPGDHFGELELTNLRDPCNAPRLKILAIVSELPLAEELLVSRFAQMREAPDAKEAFATSGLGLQFGPAANLAVELELGDGASQTAPSATQSQALAHFPCRPLRHSTWATAMLSSRSGSY